MGSTERISQYLDYKGITKYKFCKDLGFSNKFLDNSSNMGTPYGISYITHVFNGRNENPEIEKTILALYTEKVEEAKKLTEEKKAIFGTKKPEAGNIGS